MQFGLRPVRRLQVEDNDVGEVLTVLVLAAENEQLVTLPEASGVT